MGVPHAQFAQFCAPGFSRPLRRFPRVYRRRVRHVRHGSSAPAWLLPGCLLCQGVSCSELRDGSPHSRGSGSRGLSRVAWCSRVLGFRSGRRLDALGAPSALGVCPVPGGLCSVSWMVVGSAFSSFRSNPLLDSAYHRSAGTAIHSFYGKGELRQLATSFHFAGSSAQ